MNVRSYQTADAEVLWEMKQAFETGLGEAGGEAKAAAYDEKLTDSYRTRWLGWVDECVAENPRTVLLGELEADGEPVVGGYVFLLPESLAFVWDAAVLNEIYVRPRFRGCGLADELVAAATAVAREQSLPIDRLVLDVDRENDRARAFYDRHGFDHWGEMVARPLGDDGTDTDDEANTDGETNVDDETNTDGETNVDDEANTDGETNVDDETNTDGETSVDDEVSGDGAA